MLLNISICNCINICENDKWRNKLQNEDEHYCYVFKSLFMTTELSGKLHKRQTLENYSNNISCWSHSPTKCIVYVEVYIDTNTMYIKSLLQIAVSKKKKLLYVKITLCKIYNQMITWSYSSYIFTFVYL